MSRAYEVLSDPEQRKTYDRFGEEGLKQRENGGGSGDPFDMFRQAFGFGNGMGGQQQRKMPTKVAEIDLDLRTMYEGDSRRVSSTSISSLQTQILDGLLISVHSQFTMGRTTICERCDGRRHCLIISPRYCDALITLVVDRHWRKERKRYHLLSDLRRPRNPPRAAPIRARHFPTSADALRSVRTQTPSCDR